MFESAKQRLVTKTDVIALLLTVFFDLSRIASLGAIFYLIMDVAVQWGVFRFIRKEIGASGFVLITSIIMDIVVLAAFIVVKARTDMLVIYASATGLVLIFLGERLFLSHHRRPFSST